MNALFGWPGGKRNLKSVLLSLIPAHQAYVELFCGSAKLLFAKEPSRWEIINDLNEDLICFFRVAKHRPAELAEILKTETVHAGRFRELRQQAPPADELERAARFLYLTWQSFGSKGEHFASINVKHIAKAASPVHLSFRGVRDLLARTAERLADVLIEQRDCIDCIDRYDAADTFFYCDPPYVEFGNLARYAPMTAERIRELFARLAKIRGKFLLSYDDHPSIRKLATEHGMNVRRVGVRYSLGFAGADPRRERGELLIANYPLPKIEAGPPRRLPVPRKLQTGNFRNSHILAN